MNYREMTEQSREIFIALLTEKMRPWVNCRIVELDYGEHRKVRIKVKAKIADWEIINALHSLIESFGLWAEIVTSDDVHNNIIITIF